MLKISKNIYFLFKSCKNKHKKGKGGKAKEGKVVVVNIWKHRWCSAENISVCKTKIPTEYREKRCKVFQELNISNESISLIDCQSYRFLLMNITSSDNFI